MMIEAMCKYIIINQKQVFVFISSLLFLFLQVRLRNVFLAVVLAIALLTLYIMAFSY